MHDDVLNNKDFFGRKEVLLLLNKRVSALKDGYRQNIAITGQRLAGKTSVLHHFLDDLKDLSVIPIYMEIIGEPFIAFANRFIGTLLYTFLKMKGEQVCEDIEYLITKSQEYIPETVKSIKEIRRLLEKKELDKAYVEILNLTSVVKKETHLRCIVILDEFQNFSFLGVKDPFSHFGKVMMIQKDTMYIISSSDKTAIQRILTERLSLLFGNFEIVELRGFDFNSSREFLIKKLTNFTISDMLRSFLIAFTDGNPFYMDLLCAKLRDLALHSSSNVINAKIAVDAIEDLFFNPKGTVNQYFTNLINSLSLNTTTLNILTAIAKGSHTAKSIRETTKVSIAEISLRLRRLIDLNIISKNCNFYFFIDKGFLFWIKEVYNRKQASLISSATVRAEQFRHDAHSYLSKYLFELKKDPRHKISDLFSKFNKEIVQIDGKKYSLPKFNKIDLISLNKSASLVLAYKDKKIWACFIKEGAVNEDDILLFADQIKRLKLKIANKILVALDRLDINATLLAKEKRIWIWKFKDLNLVMDVYNQCKLVRYS